MITSLQARAVVGPTPVCCSSEVIFKNRQRLSSKDLHGNSLYCVSEAASALTGPRYKREKHPAVLRKPRPGSPQTLLMLNSILDPEERRATKFTRDAALAIPFC